MFTTSDTDVGLVLFVHENSTKNPKIDTSLSGNYNYSSYNHIWGKIGTSDQFLYRGFFSKADCDSSDEDSTGCILLKRTVPDPD